MRTPQVNNDREEQIRARAHQIWEEEGRPEGREQEHWNRAAREMEGYRATEEGVFTGVESEPQPGDPMPTGGRANTHDIGTGGVDTRRSSADER